MARPRIELQLILESVDPSVEKVYFQPPNNLQMEYPCIVYAREGNDIDYADNSVHRMNIRYTVTVIDPEPDSPIVEKIALLPYCSQNRSFKADNLNHDVYTLYF